MLLGEKQGFGGETTVSDQLCGILNFPREKYRQAGFCIRLNCSL